MRNRPVENRWIGQRIADPEIDLAALARAQGASASVRSMPAGARRRPSPRRSRRSRRRVAVVDVRVEPGYAPPMAAPSSADRRFASRGEAGYVCHKARRLAAPRRRKVGLGREECLEIKSHTRSDRDPRPKSDGTRRRAPVLPLSPARLIVDARVEGSRRGRRRSRPSIACRSTSRRASSSRSSARPAAASRRCSTSSAACSTVRGPRHGRGRAVHGPHPAIGMVFQEESTFPWRTVIDNVAFPLEIAGMPNARALRARAAFHRAGRARWLRAPLSVGAVGRHAPARRDRAHARRRAEDPADGRAVRGARRADAAAARRQGAADPAAAASRPRCSSRTTSPRQCNSSDRVLVMTFRPGRSNAW